MFSVPLQAGVSPAGSLPGVARFREPCGLDELELEASTAVGASRLLARLLVELTGAAGDLGAVPLSVRDRMAAHLYMHLFGELIEAVVRCSACRKPYAMSFRLSDFLAAQRPPDVLPESVEGPGADGTYVLAGRVRFRLPTIADEEAVEGLPAEQAVEILFDRCVHGADGDRAEVQSAMDALAPLLDIEMTGTCPECRASQPARFDMVGYLLTALRKERAALTREVHRLASAYHWTHDEILRLPRSVRRAYVAWIDAEGPLRGVRS